MRSRAFALALAAALAAGCGDGRSLPGETPTAADSALSPRLGGAGLTGSLRFFVSEGLVPVAERQTAAFMRRYPGAHLTVTPATAREGVAALVGGRADAALIDRPLNAEERRVFAGNQTPIREVAIGTGALAAVVPAANGVRVLSADALGRLVGGDPVAWAALADSASGALPAGNARLALAPRNAGTVELLTERLLAAGALPRPAFPAESERDVLDWVASHPDGIGIISLAVLRADTTRRVHAVALRDSAGRAVLPGQREVAEGRYALRQPVVLVVIAGRGALASAFATYARGTQGQETVLRAGLVPAVMPRREIVLR